MKKYLSLLVILSFGLSVSAQWSVGPRVGVNFSTVSGKWSEHDDTENKWITGMVAGGVGNYAFNEMFSLNAELLYISMGGKTESSWEDSRSIQSTYLLTERYNCIQLAMIARILFGGSNFSYFGSFGPYLTRKGGGTMTVDDGTNVTVLNIIWGTGQGTNRGNDGDWYVDPEYNRRWDFGLYIGGGVGKELGPGRLEFDVRFGLGLLDLNKFDSKENKQTAKDNGYKAYRNMNISLSVAYMYLFKK